MPSSQILPLLWIGDEYAASPPEVHAFGCVLNITVEIKKCKDLVDNDVQYQRFPIFDYGGEKQMQLMFGYALIEQASGRQVLVHCVEEATVMRSCGCVSDLRLGDDSDQAKQHILKNRPVAFDSGSHVNFAPALEQWEKTIQGNRSSAKQL